MGLFKARIFQNSAFKQAKFLMGSSTEVQHCLRLRENRILTLDSYPMADGCCWDTATKKAWNIDSRLLLSVEGCDSPVLLITDRARYPCDPNNKYTSEDKALFVDIKKLGRERYKAAFARIGDEAKESENAKMVKALLWLFGIIVLSLIIAIVVRG